MNTVDLWKISLDPTKYNLLTCLTTLDQQEQARAHRFMFESIRDRFVISHYALRKILSEYVFVAPHEIRYQYNQRQKPELVPEINSETIQFNLSHSHDVAMVAITTSVPIGIDVEYIKKDLDYLALAQRFFSAEEYALLTALDGSERINGFFNCWTRKEAFIKAIGQGLYCSLKQFAVNLAPAEPARFLRIDPDIDDIRHWTLQSFQPQADYVAAFACPQSISQVKNHEFF